MDYCTACGCDISPGNGFCTACGAPVRQPGVPWYRRWPFVIGIMLSAAVCGVGLAALLAPQPKGNSLTLSAGQNPATSAPASSAPGSPNPSGSGSGSLNPAAPGSGSPGPAASGSGLASAPPSEQSAAQALAQLLASSVSDRSAVVNAVSDVNACGDVSQDEQTFQQAASSRQQLIGQLSSLSGASTLPAQMLQDLTAAWQASVQADQDFAAWASDENSGGCTPDGSGDSNFHAATGPDNEATTDKMAFVSLWNPIASQYELTTYAWNQL
jgi:hypothetical protein